VNIKTKEEILNVENPAWEALVKSINSSNVRVKALDNTPEQGLNTLYRIQVTTRSYMGALILHTGGLLVDHGWLRMLGSGYKELPSIADVNHFAPVPQIQLGFIDTMIIAYDVMGGRFAVDGGGFGLGFGEVCYNGPDTLKWESMGMKHDEFIEWILEGGLDTFYANLRWHGWEQEVSNLRLDEGISASPPPYTVEGQDPNKVSRQVVPFKKVLDLNESLEKTHKNLS